MDEDVLERRVALLPFGGRGDLRRKGVPLRENPDRGAEDIRVEDLGRLRADAIEKSDRVPDARLHDAPGVDRATWFVANWSRDRIPLGENRLGKGLSAYDQR